MTVKAQPVIFNGTPSSTSLLNKSMKSFNFAEQSALQRQPMFSPQHQLSKMMNMLPQTNSKH